MGRHDEDEDGDEVMDSDEDLGEETEDALQLMRDCHPEVGSELNDNGTWTVSALFKEGPEYNVTSTEEVKAGIMLGIALAHVAASEDAPRDLILWVMTIQMIYDSVLEGTDDN